MVRGLLLRFPASLRFYFQVFVIKTRNQLNPPKHLSLDENHFQRNKNWIRYTLKLQYQVFTTHCVLILNQLPVEIGLINGGVTMRQNQYL